VQSSLRATDRVSLTRWPNTLWLVLIAIVVSAAFLNGIAVPLLLDDEVSIVGNESIRKLTPLLSPLWPRGEVYTAGRPLLNLSFALNYAFGGTAVRGYHVVNILIHVTAALMLFGIVRRTLLLPRFDHRFDRHAPVLALSAALLWAIHPLQTISVTYISQRAESLMGLCYLCTLYGLIRSSESTGSGWRVFTVASCLVGMLVKEVIVTAPVILLLFDRTFLAGSLKEAWRRRGGLYASLAATWLVLLALMFASRIQERGVGFSHSFAWHQYLRIECAAVLHYLRLAFFPSGLVFDYGEDVTVPSATRLTVCGMILAGVVVASIRAVRRRSVIGFLACWFFLILAPTSSFLPVAGQPIAENRVYLPLAAVSVAVVMGTFHVLRTRSHVAVLASAMSFMALTLSRNTMFQSPLLLWADTVAKRPNTSRAWSYYGNALVQAGRHDEAIKCFETALRLRAYWYPHLSLACVLLGQQRTQDAIPHLVAAINLNPKEPASYMNLGTAMFQLGRSAEALQYYDQALRVRPGYPDAQANMAIVLARLGRMTEAIALFEQTLRDDPHHQTAREQMTQVRAFMQQQPPVR
jgi:protein O-mannosyl-transferase